MLFVQALTPQRHVSYYLVWRQEVKKREYCVKGRAGKDIRNPKDIIMNNERPATRAVFSTCGTKVFTVGKSQHCHITQNSARHDMPGACKSKGGSQLWKR